MQLILSLRLLAICTQTIKGKKVKTGKYHTRSPCTDLQAVYKSGLCAQRSEQIFAFWNRCRLFCCRQCFLPVVTVHWSWRWLENISFHYGKTCFWPYYRSQDYSLEENFKIRHLTLLETCSPISNFLCKCASYIKWIRIISKFKFPWDLQLHCFKIIPDGADIVCCCFQNFIHAQCLI